MKTIGAAFSGGGFRAAGFTFGCLDMLHRAQLGNSTLLQNIAFSSSTSGGSLAMAFHAVRSHKGMPFPDILKELRTIISGETLLAQAVANLKDDAVWRDKYPTKTRNFINAFAIVYHEQLLDHAQVGLFQDKSKNPPIGRYCFNTTELDHALSFRFDLSGDPAFTEEVGNWRQHFGTGTEAALDRIRLADVAAASSCFPGGFEPILFPRDFRNAATNDPLDHALVDDQGHPLPGGERSFGLVDGGVVDNQGLYALNVEAGRRIARASQPFDLLISCDVSSFYVDRYEAPDAAASWKPGLKLMGLMGITLGLLGCVVAAWLLALLTCSKVIALVLTPPAVLAAFAGIKLALALRKREGTPGSWSAAFHTHGLPTLKGLSLGTLRTMLRTRKASLSLILGDAFMTQIRRQQYAAILGPSGPTPMISCMVYELAGKNRKNLERQKDKRRNAAKKLQRVHLWDAAVAKLHATPAMETVADSAASMGTTLWFDAADRHKLDHLIACGQFTMCFNLLVYLAEVEYTTSSLTPEQQALRTQLEADWRLFQMQPLFRVPTTT